MKIKLNGWHRLGVLVSVLWCLFILLQLSISAASRKNSDFEESTEIYCHPFKERPFLAWYDTITNNEISVYLREGESLTCGEVSYRASAIREKYNKGEIKPELKIIWSSVITVLFIPMVLFWLISYSFVHTAKWVLSGFRPKLDENKTVQSEEAPKNSTVH